MLRRGARPRRLPRSAVTHRRPRADLVVAVPRRPARRCIACTTAPRGYRPSALVHARDAEQLDAHRRRHRRWRRRRRRARGRQRRRSRSSCSRSARSRDARDAAAECADDTPSGSLVSVALGRSCTRAAHAERSRDRRALLPRRREGVRGAELRRGGAELRRGVQGAAAAGDRVLGGAGVSPAVPRRCRSPSTCGARSSSTGSISTKVKTGGRVGDAADSLGEMERELDKLERRAPQGGGRTAVEHTRLGVNVTIADQAQRDDARCARSATRPARPTEGPHRDARRQADRAVRARRRRAEAST